MHVCMYMYMYWFFIIIIFLKLITLILCLNMPVVMHKLYTHKFKSNFSVKNSYNNV